MCGSGGVIPTGSATCAWRARWAAIQLAPHGSWPSSRSAARTLSTHTGAVLMIALVRPAAIAMGRNAALSTWRCGRPKDTLERTERHVDAQLRADQADRLERGRDRLGVGADRHRERVDHDVRGRDPVVAGRLDDLGRDLEPLLGRLGDPGLVVGEPDHRRAVLGHERQDLLQPLVLAGDGVHERLALVDRQPGLERLDDRRVDAHRQVRVGLDRREHLLEQLGLVDERDAGVDVEDVGAGLGLRLGVDDDGRQVAAAQLLGEALAPRGVDALPDDAERLLGPDRDGPRPRLQDCVHALPSRLVAGFPDVCTTWRCRRPCGTR